MKGNWWFEANPDHALLKNREQVKAILQKDQNILGVFSGHQHWTKQIVENGIHYYVIGSLTENLNGDGIPDGVYYIVEFNGKDIQVVQGHIRL